MIIFCNQIVFPAGMRCLWEISIRSPLSETSQRPLRNISKEKTFLWRLKDISKEMSFAWRLSDVSNISQKSCLLRNISETSQKHLLQVFVIFQKYPTIMVSRNFRRVTEILDKIDMGPLETPKKWKVFWEQWIVINQVCHEYQWADICVRVLASKQSSKSYLNLSALFTIFSDFFRLIRLFISCCLCLKYRNFRQVKDKMLRN